MGACSAYLQSSCVNVVRVDSWCGKPGCRTLRDRSSFCSSATCGGHGRGRYTGRGPSRGGATGVRSAWHAPLEGQAYHIQHFKVYGVWCTSTQQHTLDTRARTLSSDQGPQPVGVSDLRRARGTMVLGCGIHGSAWLRAAQPWCAARHGRGHHGGTICIPPGAKRAALSRTYPPPTTCRRRRLARAPPGRTPQTAPAASRTCVIETAMAMPRSTCRTGLSTARYRDHT